jgi:RNA polymerase sigma factor (TIGR02999 family)
MDRNTSHSADREVTSALRDLACAKRGSEERLFRLVYAELKRIAGHHMDDQRSGHTLQPTALVHETYVRLLGREDTPSFEDRRHFFNAAASAMRSILVDHARRRNAAKRGDGARRIGLVPDLTVEALSERVELVDEVLDRFAEEFPRQAEVVKLLFFAGLSTPEVSAAMGVSESTVKRDWRFGRAWLFAEMNARSE